MSNFIGLVLCLNLGLGLNAQAQVNAKASSSTQKSQVKAKAAQSAPQKIPSINKMMTTPTSPAALTNPALAQKPADIPTWSGFVQASGSRNLVDFQDGTRRDVIDYIFRLNYRLNESYGLRVQSGYSQDLKYTESSDFTDSAVSFGKVPFALGSHFKMGYRLSSSIPTSKDSKIRQSLITALSLSVPVLLNPELLPEGLQISGMFSVARNIHQYETALDGRVNTQYSSAQALSLGYSFSSGIYLSADFMHRNLWSYQNVMRDAFEFSQEIGYSHKNIISFGLGHTNSGSTLKANAQESNVEFFNENTSIVYLSSILNF